MVSARACVFGASPETAGCGRDNDHSQHHHHGCVSNPSPKINGSKSRVFLFCVHNSFFSVGGVPHLRERLLTVRAAAHSRTSHTSNMHIFNPHPSAGRQEKSQPSNMPDDAYAPPASSLPKPKSRKIKRRTTPLLLLIGSLRRHTSLTGK